VAGVELTRTIASGLVVVMTTQLLIRTIVTVQQVSRVKCIT
jgi:hypothetical protein